jgi:hypothetical protein
MATARELDVVITKKTKATVYYELTMGGRAEEWRVPNASTFDLDRLEVGKRYRVWTTSIWSDEHDYRVGHPVRKLRYEWVSVQELSLSAKSTTKTAKQTEASKELAAKPFADNGDLFQWGDKTK